MKIKYFEDTDTALIEFSEQSVHETKEINENIWDVHRKIGTFLFSVFDIQRIIQRCMASL